MAMTYHLDGQRGKTDVFRPGAEDPVTGSEGELGIFPAMRRC